MRRKEEQVKAGANAKYMADVVWELIALMHAGKCCPGL